MANLTLRLVKGVPLTNAEVDSNFSNLNISKVEIGRDLSGNIYYPVVSGIQGRDVTSTAPSDAQVLQWSTSGNAWAPATVTFDTLLNPPVANIILTGDVTGSANAVLTANSTIITISATTIQANSVALGTDTTGDYVANVLAGTGIVLSDQGGETASPTVSLDVSGVTANTYGGSSKVPVLTIDQYGRVTAAANVNVAGVTSFAASGNSFTISTADGGSFTANIQQDSVRLGTDTTGNYVSTVTVGSGLTVTGTADEGNVVTVAHLDTSSVSNVNSDNSDGNVLQDLSIDFDDFGHVTNVSVAVANLDDRYLRLSSDIPQSVSGGNVSYSSNVSITGALTAGNIDILGYLKFSNGNSIITSEPNSSGDGYGYTTLKIVPDNSLDDNQNQHLIIDPTVPNHLHLRAGGLQDSSNASLYIGGENTYFNIPPGTNPAAYIASNNKIWEFEQVGGLKVPGRVNFQQNAYIPLGAPYINGANDRITLWDFQGTGTGYNYAIGAEPNHVWFMMDVNNSTGGFKFYSRTNEIFKIRDDGSIFTANVLPRANLTYDLGSPTQRFKDLYLSGNTLILGEATLSTTGDSVSITAIDDTPIGATTRNTGAFTSLAANVITANAIQGIIDNSLVTNLNADLLDSQQGSYYLDWTNQTNKPSINVAFTGDVTGAGNVTLTNNNTNSLSIELTVQPNSVALGTDTTGNYVSTVTVGSGLTVTGTADEGNVVTVAHADTSSVTNVSSDNSDGTVIQDISLGFDTFGHVTSATVATVNLDNRYLRLSTGSLQTVTGPVTFEQNVIFAGNVTTIAANNLIITDNFIYLNDGDDNSNIDFGFVGNYNDGTYQHAGFFRDASDGGTWKVFEGYLPEPDAAVDIDTANASFRLANFAAKNITAVGNLIIMPGMVDSVANTVTLTTTTESTVHSFSATTYNSGKFVITGKQGSNVQISEFLVAHDGSIASGTEYGVVKTSNVTVFSANVDINSGNMRIRVIGSSDASTKYVLAGSQIYA